MFLLDHNIWARVQKQIGLITISFFISHFYIFSLEGRCLENFIKIFESFFLGLETKRSRQFRKNLSIIRKFLKTLKMEQSFED